MEDTAIYISYAITEAFCICFALGIIVKSNKNVGTDLQMKHFRGMSMFFIMYLISDSWWALGQGGIIPFSRTLNKISSAAGLVSVSLLTLAWCIFVIYRIGNIKVRKINVLKGIHYSAAAVDCILIISSVFNDFYFYIDENDIYQLSPGYNVHLILIFFQLFGSGVFSFAQSFKNTQVKMKKEYRLPLLFIILPAAAAVLEGMLPLSPIVPLGTFMAIHLAFLEIQNSEIYSDALTGLNNRRSMELFLQDMIHNSSEDNSFCVYMIDVNDFKLVNDKFGHLAGDRALQLVAEAIHKISDSNRGFCARYGGDEFVLIMSKPDEDLQKTVQDKVNILRNACADLLPQISISAGFTICNSSSVTAAQLIAQADEKLYVQKEIYHGRKKAAEV